MCFSNIMTKFISIFFHRSHKCCIEFHWEMCFEICCLIGNHCITHGVWFIEWVRCSRLYHLFVDILSRFFFVIFVFFSSNNKFFFKLLNYFLLLFSNSSSKQICFSQRESCHRLHQKHQLLLINSNTVRQIHNWS